MMKRIYNILLAVLSLAVVACVEDINPDIPSAESGDEVQFGLALGDPETKTVYGNETGNAFPIYWINGDKVHIFSPQCLEGRRSAEYEVSVAQEQQNYADQLTKTGDYGVQWGAAEKAIFYSLYPSGKYTLSDEGTYAQGVTINYSQNIIVNGTTIKSDMEDCLMYAKNDGGETNNFEGVTKGATVNLAYKPISTVVYVTMEVAENTDAKVDNFTIQSVSLTAPGETYIAGTFSLKIADGSFGEFAANQASNTVLAQITDSSTGGFHTISNKQTLSIPLFLAPVSGLNVNGWKVKVVANNHTYTKTINIDQTLTPGKIHKISLPKFAAEETEWETGNWMENIPRNVYLSEVSIPGSWNSLNVDCQSNTSISDQYGLGVRAFHLDTRWRADNKPSLNSDRFIFSSPTITELSVATGGSNQTYSYSGGNLMRPSHSSFAEYLKQITANVKDNEYMVVFCTFSHNSYNDNGDLCPSTWFEAVSNACAANDRVYNASSLTANTLVGDVLGKVIVIVNLESSVSDNTLPANSKCLFTYVPMLLPSDYYAETSSHTDALYYSTKSLTGISMYTSHAQISTTNTSSVYCGDRGYSHPLTSRDNLVTSFWDWSKSNYGTTNYSHDKWIYLGLGGYIMDSYGSSGTGYDTIENRYAPMVYNRIDEMGSNNIPFYPIGIILMNNKKGSNYTEGQTDLGYGFSDVCKKILLLNNEYRLQYDPNKPSDYNPNATTKSAAPSYSSGMNDSNVAAFGWD